MGIRIKSNERLCFFGRTGSGKTTLAKNLLRVVPAWAVLDPKHTFKENGVPIVRSFEKRKQRQIIRVPFDSEDERWLRVIEQLWRARNRVCYVDEGTLVNPSRTSISPQLGKAIRTGRERNVGVWFGSQRPKDIPSAVFTEAEHFFVFQLQFKPDREKVASFTCTEMERAIETLTGHQFIYYSVADGRMELRELRLRSERKRTGAS